MPDAGVKISYSRRARRPDAIDPCRRPSPAFCSTTPRRARTRRRCARRIRHLADADLARARRARSRALAGGLAEAGLQRGQHLVVIGENRPRLYASMLAAQSLGAIPVPLYQDAAAAEFVFPIAQRRRRVRGRRGPGAGRQAARGARPRARSSRTIWFDDPPRPAPLREPGARAARRADRGRPRARAPRIPASSTPRSRRARPDDVAAMFFTSGTTGNAEGRRPQPRHADRPRRAGAALRQAGRRRGSARLPAAGLDRPEHLLVRAVARLRLRRQLPGVGEHGDDRPEARSGRPTTSRRRASSRAC